MSSCRLAVQTETGLDWIRSLDENGARRCVPRPFKQAEQLTYSHLPLTDSIAGTALRAHVATESEWPLPPKCTPRDGAFGRRQMTIQFIFR